MLLIYFVHFHFIKRQPRKPKAIKMGNLSAINDSQPLSVATKNCCQRDAAGVPDWCGRL